LTELREHPKTGTGKPELLKHYETPTWSRRINDRHRLIYRIEDSNVVVLILSFWGHYGDK
jgi:toxin YoeB